MKSGTIRTVLSVRRKGDRLVSAMMPILACSWTKRGHTLVDRWTLRTYAKKCVGNSARRLRHPIAKRLLEESGNTPRTISCCDVTGVFE